MPSEHNRRILKNTVMLYIRMFVMMAITLYTSRVVLNTLGVDDFGIYEIVGGVVVLFAFLNNAMLSATQRFLNFELGQDNLSEVKKVFSASLTIHIFIALLIFFLSETVGLWFLNSRLNIPPDRLNAANWVYQFSILTFCAQIIRLPYSASIIAYERMNFYAYLSILEAVLQLSVVFLLKVTFFDKLIFYSALVFTVALLLTFVYKWYCNYSFEITRYRIVRDKALFYRMMSFSGWSLFGSAANLSAQQGLNILLNIFLGVVVNAAIGIANQVSGAIYRFISNLQTAFTPQLIKFYAVKDREAFINLLFNASKFSFFLFLFLTIPVLLCTDFILGLWLGQVPEFTTVFCRLIIVYLLIDAISAPLWLSIEATGEVRNYQIMMGTLVFMNLPLAYLALKMGFSPYSVWVIRVIINAVAYVIRILYLKNKIQLPVARYLRVVVWRSVLVAVLAFPLPFIANYYLHSWEGLLTTVLVSVFSTAAVIYLVGLNRAERSYMVSVIGKIIKR